MVACPFCQEIVANQDELQVHLVSNCSASDSVLNAQPVHGEIERGDENTDLEVVELQFKWNDNIGVHEPEIYLISSLAGSVPLFTDKYGEEKMYLSKILVVPTGEHQCQLVVGENIHQAEVINISPMTGVAEIFLEKGSGSDDDIQYENGDDDTKIIEASAHTEIENDPNRTKVPEESGLSPLHRELIEHQVVHGEPLWVPKDDARDPVDVPLPSDSSFMSTQPEVQTEDLLINRKDGSEEEQQFDTSLDPDTARFGNVGLSNLLLQEEFFDETGDSLNEADMEFPKQDYGDVEGDPHLHLPGTSVAFDKDSDVLERMGENSSLRRKSNDRVSSPETVGSIRSVKSKAEVDTNWEPNVVEDLQAKCLSYETEVVRLRKDNETLLQCILNKESKEQSTPDQLKEDMRILSDQNLKLTEEIKSIRVAHLLREDDLRKMNSELEEEINSFKVKFKDLESRLESDNRVIALENVRLKEQNESKERKIKHLLDENAELIFTVDRLRKKLEIPRYRERDKFHVNNHDSDTLDQEHDMLLKDIQTVLEGFGASSGESPPSVGRKAEHSFERYKENGDVRSYEVEKYSSSPTDVDSLSDFYSPRIPKRVDINGNYFPVTKTTPEKTITHRPDHGRGSDFPTIRKSLLDQPLDNYKHLSRKTKDNDKKHTSYSKAHDLFKEFKSKTYDPTINSVHHLYDKNDFRDTEDPRSEPIKYNVRNRRERPHSYHEKTSLSRSVFNDNLSLQGTASFLDASLSLGAKASRASRSYSSGINDLGKTSSTPSTTWSFDKPPLRPFAPTSPTSVKTGLPITVLRSKGGVTRGTVRWSGYLPGHRESYVGVELAVESGLNDGAVDGIRYFQCKPGYGLFVPFSRILMLWDYGSAET